VTAADEFSVGWFRTQAQQTGPGTHDEFRLIIAYTSEPVPRCYF